MWSPLRLLIASLGFGDRFAELATAGFPDAGSYMGAKVNIGLRHVQRLDQLGHYMSSMPALRGDVALPCWQTWNQR